MSAEHTHNGLSVQYSNWMARIFLKSAYENQWVIPEPLSPLIAKFLRWYEHNRMSIDLTEIQIDRPIFIISLPRCGSSMLQDILCTHPDLAYTTNLMDISRPHFCAAEHFRKKLNLNIRGERFLKDSVVVDGSSPADPVATWADFFGEDYYEIGNRAPSIDALSLEQTNFIQTSLKKVLWSAGKPQGRFFCKTPMLLPYVGVLNQLFPDAKFIHLIRDPRQGANSMVKIHQICNQQLCAIHQRKGLPAPEKPFIPYPRLPKLNEHLENYGPEDIRTTAHLWNDAIEIVDTHRGSLKNLFEVRYEDILADPRAQLQELFQFCGLSTPMDQNSNYQDRLNGVGVIHHKNDYHDFSTVESICADSMKRFNYLD